MVKKAKSWFSLVELGIYVAILGVIIGIVAVNGYILYQNSIDTRITQNLKTLSEGTQLFMVDTNGVAPCFTPEVKEGGAATGSYCEHSKYDYVQGKSDKNLDFDETIEEDFTFENILAPTYIAKIPDAGRRGEYFFYTKGKPTTNQGASSFAYMAKLGGTKAEDKVDANTSLINLLLTTGNDEATLKSCALTDINFTGTEIGTTSKYMKFDGLLTSGASKVITNAAGCDLYTEGLNVVKEAFTEAQGGAGNSTTTTVQAKK